MTKLDQTEQRAGDFGGFPRALVPTRQSRPRYRLPVAMQLSSSLVTSNVLVACTEPPDLSTPGSRLGLIARRRQSGAEPRYKGQRKGC
jgi:hypothetical protein